MHELKIEIRVKNGISVSQLIELDKTLHTKVNEYLLSLPIRCDKEVKVLEHTHA